jgi:hypothetical protein
VPHCAYIVLAIGISAVISLPATCGLFFFRVKGVYYNNRIIIVLFGALWFALFGVTFLFPLALQGAHIGPTQKCTIVKVADFFAAPAVLNSVFDTLVFVAISLRIVSMPHTQGSLSTRAGTFFRGDGLSKVARALLQGGQLYYLCIGFLSSSLLVTYTFPLLSVQR